LVSPLPHAAFEGGEEGEVKPSPDRLGELEVERDRAVEFSAAGHRLLQVLPLALITQSLTVEAIYF